MAEQRDWIDRAIAPATWEPPAGFTDRLVLQAMATLPRQAGFRERLVAVVTGWLESASARLEGSVWMLRQYRALMTHW